MSTTLARARLIRLPAWGSLPVGGARGRPARRSDRSVDGCHARAVELRAVRNRPGAAAGPVADDSLLFAVNTPDNRLEIFRSQGNHVAHRARCRSGSSRSPSRRSDERGVGRQPPLRQRQHRRRLDRRLGRAWCGRCSSATSRATSSSPGPGRSRAFITTAHRGQNVPFDPQLTTPGVGRADVWVFDATISTSDLASAARR